MARLPMRRVSKGGLWRQVPGKSPEDALDTMVHILSEDLRRHRGIRLGSERRRSRDVTFLNTPRGYVKIQVTEEGHDGFGRVYDAAVYFEIPGGEAERDRWVDRDPMASQRVA